MTGHFEVIKASSPHIYHSALMLAPKDSIVWKLYEPYAHPFIRVVWGAPTSSTAAKRHSSEIEEAVWSPCNRFIAIALMRTHTADILDSTTLQHLQTLESPKDVPTEKKQLAFSPDGCILSCSSGGTLGQLFAIVSWDLQTGGIISVIRHNRPDLGYLTEPTLVYSADGKMLGFSGCDVQAGGADPAIKTLNISFFDVTAGIHVHSHSLEAGMQFLRNIWVHGGSLQFTTSDRTTMTIWEVEPTPSAPPTPVGTVPAPHHLHLVHQMMGQPLPTSYQFVGSFQDELQVWDASDSKYLLKYKFHSNICDMQNILTQLKHTTVLHVLI